MAGNRKEVESFILKYINKIDKSGLNNKLYTDLFKSLNDVGFDNLMKSLRANLKGNHSVVDGVKSKTLSIIVPTEGDVKFKTEDGIKIGKELGHNFFQQLIVEPNPNEDPNSDNYKPKYKTKEKYLVYMLPWRRTRQLSSKGMSVSEDNNAIDLNTGQVTGKSASSKMTKPEAELLIAMGANKTLKELYMMRGGDQGARRAANGYLTQYGEVTLDAIEQFSTGVGSTNTLGAMLKACHIQPTLED